MHEESLACRKDERQCKCKSLYTRAFKIMLQFEIRHAKQTKMWKVRWPTPSTCYAAFHSCNRNCIHLLWSFYVIWPMDYITAETCRCHLRWKIQTIAMPYELRAAARQLLPPLQASWFAGEPSSTVNAVIVPIHVIYTAIQCVNYEYIHSTTHIFIHRKRQTEKYTDLLIFQWTWCMTSDDVHQDPYTNIA